MGFVWMILIGVTLYYVLTHKGMAWQAFKMDMRKLGRWLSGNKSKTTSKSKTFRSMPTLSIDQILEKIKRHGMRSLTPEEKNKLTKYSNSL
jgi:hypothetical protein